MSGKAHHVRGKAARPRRRRPRRRAVTLFAPGGIAFHGGSLTTASHGCVHLTVANARYFQDHLPIGAEVVVF